MRSVLVCVILLCACGPTTMQKQMRRQIAAITRSAETKAAYDHECYRRLMAHESECTYALLPVASVHWTSDIDPAGNAPWRVLLRGAKEVGEAVVPLALPALIGSEIAQ